MWLKRGTIIACAFTVAGCAGKAPVPDTGALRGADIVILGEVHDNPHHHRSQAALIIELAPTAVAFEMLSPGQATIANNTAARGRELRDDLEWDSSGWPEWDLYQPVFEAVGDVPIYGMALGETELSRGVSEGAAAIFGTDAEKFGLTAALPEAEQAAREAHQHVVHCNMLPESMLPGMVEAQRLRDAAFARTALQALRENGGPVVVVTGSGHARTDWGMPAALRAAAPAVRVASLGQLEEEPEQSPPFDSWMVTEPAQRKDPCETFTTIRGADEAQGEL